MKMKRWKCTVCNYVYTGEKPPEKCPECGLGPEYFEFLDEVEVDITEEEQKKIQNALFKVQYGLFVVGSHKEEKINAQICNTVFQITSSPIQVAVGINKNNLTHEYIVDSGTLSISILGEDCQDLVKRFGYKSGKDFDKFKDLEYTLTDLGNPLIKDVVAEFDCKVIKDKTVDLGTHTLFMVEIVEGRLVDDKEAVTYSLYRKLKKQGQKSITSDVPKWECQICGYVHEGENPPEICPTCGLGPEEFKKLNK